MLLLGHRGASRYAPQNTFAAFDLALTHGADGFECDLRCTGDGKVIICHGPRLSRRFIRHSTFRQLQSKSANTEHPLPRLEHVVQKYSSRAFLDIEIKVRGIEAPVLQALRDFPPQNGYFVSSFLPTVLREIRKIDESVVLGAGLEYLWQLRRWEALPALYVVPNYRLLSRKLVEEVHAAQKFVVTWTVNDSRQMLRAADLGVDGIISDDTKLLVKTLKDRT